MSELETDHNAIIRTDEEEHAYFLRRAADHDALAERTTDPATQAIHLRLRQLYADRAARITIVVSD